MPWSQTAAPSLGQELVTRADRRYGEVGWPRAEKKDYNDVVNGKLWGGDVAGNRGTLGVELGKRMHLASFTLRSLMLRWTGREFAALLGDWSPVMQLRRPGYSVFSEVYRCQMGWPLDERQLGRGRGCSLLRC